MAGVLFILYGSVFAAAPQCNDGVTASVVPGIPVASCYLTTTSIQTGIQVNSSPAEFFVDVLDSKVIMNNQERQIRFIMYASDADYNATQALVQTGYATRSTFSIIFPNPDLASSPCTTVVSSLTVAFVQCPFQAITLSH